MPSGSQAATKDDAHGTQNHKGTLANNKRGSKSKSNNRPSPKKKAERKHQSAKNTTDADASTITYKPLHIDEETRWKPTSVFRHTTATTPTANNNNQNEGALPTPTTRIENVEELVVLDDRDERLVRWLLNKITPTNFDKVMIDYMSETTIYQDETRIRNAIETIMDRSSMDPRFSSVYAQVIGRLATFNKCKGDKDESSNNDGSGVDVATSKTTGTTTTDDDDDGCSNVSFRAILLQICEEEINQSTARIEDHHQNHERRRESDVLTSTENVIQLQQKRQQQQNKRRRYVGGKRMIGELYNHKVLEAKQVIYYLKSLLRRARGIATTTTLQQGQPPEDDNDEKVVATVDEIAFEGFLVLLDTCGKKLDDSSPCSLPASLAEDLSIPCCLPASEAEDLQYCWDILGSMLQQQQQKQQQPKQQQPRQQVQLLLSFRMRFMVLDLVELRQSSWHPIRYGTKQKRDMVPTILDPDAAIARSSKTRNKAKKKNKKKGENNNNNKKQVQFVPQGQKK